MVAALKLCPLETDGRREPVLVLEMVTALKLCPFETYGRQEPVRALELVTVLKLFAPSRLMGARNPCRSWSWPPRSKLSPTFSLRDLWVSGTRAGLGDGH